MLRASAIAFEYEFNLASIGDPSISTGIPGGTELLLFVDAVIGSSVPEIRHAQTAVIGALRPEGLADAAGVFGNFEMMNRVAEGTGIPIAVQAIERMADTIDELGIRHFIKS